MQLLGETERIRKALECQDDHMRVWTKWELPYRLHSVRSNRIPNLMLDLDLGWRGMFKQEEYSSLGDHGWDFLYEEMHAIFVAHGPSFRKDLTAKPFQNVQLYNLMCALIDIEPAENNGTWGALHHLLVSGRKVELNATQLHCRSLNESSEYEEQLLNQTISQLDPNQDNITGDNETELLRLHAPLGVPQAAGNELERLGLLINRDYVAGFDYEQSLPLWTEYTLTEEGHRANIVDEHDNLTWIPDLRISQKVEHLNESINETSVDQNVENIHLFPKGSHFEIAIRIKFKLEQNS